MATYQEYEAKLKGVNLPLELLIPELERVNIYPDDLEEGSKVDSSLYYQSVGKFLPIGRHQIEYYEDGVGTIGYWLKKGMNLSAATMKVELLLFVGGTEKLYSKLHIMRNHGRETEVYIFTTVAKRKDLI